MGIMQLEREGSPQPGLRLPQAKLSRKSNQVARGRIGGSNPVCPTGQSVSNAYGIGSRSKCHEMTLAGGVADRQEATCGDGPRELAPYWPTR